MFGLKATSRGATSRKPKLILKRAELLLLATFLCPRPDKPNYYLTSQVWRDILGNEDSEVVKQLREGGLIRLATNVESLEAIATPQWLADVAAHFKMPPNVPAIDVISRLARAATPTDMRRFCPVPMEIASDLGAKLATDFMRREEVFNFDKAYRTPPDGMISGIRAFGAFLLTAIASGIIGNRSDALFVQSVGSNATAPAAASIPTGSHSSNTDAAQMSEADRLAISKVSTRQDSGDGDPPQSGDRSSSSKAPDHALKPSLNHHEAAALVAMPLPAAAAQSASGGGGQSQPDVAQASQGASGSDAATSILEKVIGWFTGGSHP